MHASTLIVALSAVASASASALRYRSIPTDAAAVPAAVIEKRAEPTEAWVTVNDEAQPEATYTPSMTVVDGVTSYKDGAPHDLTATVFTITSWGKITTSTGEPPNPTATAKSGQGAFSRCRNTDGANAPFCYPSADSVLYIGSTYYITWDPDYFNKSGNHGNTTYEVSFRLDSLNSTSKGLDKVEHFDRNNATYGFWPFYIDSKYLKDTKKQNFSISLWSNIKGSTQTTNVTAIWVQLSQPGLDTNNNSSGIKGHTLSIALPTVFGAIVLLVVGGCLWNRKTRSISMGNIMSRSRHGYSGRKTRRMFGRKNNGIQLDTRAPPPGEYSDAPQRPRRDSDGLGSLANSPIDPSFHQQGTTGGRNAFRDEISRQDRERR